MSINFFSESLSFELKNAESTKKWIRKILDDHRVYPVELNCIFCPDDYLLKINQKHLNHDYYTDIITFDHSEEEKEIAGDLFISIDRVKENAQTHRQSFEKELSRVIAHGLLHLIGYGDKTEPERKLMREKEDACLSLRKMRFSI